MSDDYEIGDGAIDMPSYRRSAEIGELFTALAKAQGEFEGAEKDGKNPAFRSAYATLASVVAATRDPLAKHGLCCMQLPHNMGDNIGVTTLLGHTSGQWLENTLYVAPAKFDAQGVGSVITYLRRYGRMAILGLAPEDDDGEAAVKRPGDVEKPSTLSGRPVSKAHPAVRPASTRPPLTDGSDMGEVPPDAPPQLIEVALKLADQGHDAIRIWFDGLGEADKFVLRPQLPALRERARKADLDREP